MKVLMPESGFILGWVKEKPIVATYIEVNSCKNTIIFGLPISPTSYVNEDLSKIPEPRIPSRVVYKKLHKSCYPEVSYYKLEYLE